MQMRSFRGNESFKIVSIGLSFLDNPSRFIKTRFSFKFHHIIQVINNFAVKKLSRPTVDKTKISNKDRLSFAIPNTPSDHRNDANRPIGNINAHKHHGENPRSTDDFPQIAHILTREPTCFSPLHFRNGKNDRMRTTISIGDSSIGGLRHLARLSIIGKRPVHVRIEGDLFTSSTCVIILTEQ